LLTLENLRLALLTRSSGAWENASHSPRRTVSSPTPTNKESINKKLPTVSSPIHLYHRLPFCESKAVISPAWSWGGLGWDNNVTPIFPNILIHNLQRQTHIRAQPKQILLSRCPRCQFKSPPIQQRAKPQSTLKRLRVTQAKTPLLLTLCDANIVGSGEAAFPSGGGWGMAASPTDIESIDKILLTVSSSISLYYCLKYYESITVISPATGWDSDCSSKTIIHDLR